MGGDESARFRRFIPISRVLQGVFVVDIACPDCGRTSPVQKIALGRYRCGECDVEFSPRELQ